MHRPPREDDAPSGGLGGRMTLSIRATFEAKQPTAIRPFSPPISSISALRTPPSDPADSLDEDIGGIAHHARARLRRRGG